MNQMGMSFQEHLELAQRKQQKKEEKRVEVSTEELLKRMDATGNMNRLFLKIKNHD